MKIVSVIKSLNRPNFNYQNGHASEHFQNKLPNWSFSCITAFSQQFSLSCKHRMSNLECQGYICMAEQMNIFDNKFHSSRKSSS